MAEGQTLEQAEDSNEGTSPVVVPGGALMRKAMKEHHLSAKDVVKGLDPPCNVQAVYRWCSGKRSPLFDCWRVQIEKMLGVPRKEWERPKDPVRERWLEQHANKARRFEQIALPGFGNDETSEENES